MRHWKWMTALVVFLLFGYQLGLGSIGSGFYLLVGIALLACYHNKLVHLFVGDMSTLLFIEEELRELSACDSTYEETIDQIQYPSDNRNRQWDAYPNHYKNFPIYNSGGRH